MSAARTTSYMLKTTVERNLYSQGTFKAVLSCDFVVVCLFVCLVSFVLVCCVFAKLFCRKQFFLKNAYNVHNVMKHIQVGIGRIFFRIFRRLKCK